MVDDVEGADIDILRQRLGKPQRQPVVQRRREQETRNHMPVRDGRKLRSQGRGGVQMNLKVAPEIKEAVLAQKRATGLTMVEVIEALVREHLMGEQVK